MEWSDFDKKTYCELALYFDFESLVAPTNKTRNCDFCRLGDYKCQISYTMDTHQHKE